MQIIAHVLASVVCLAGIASTLMLIVFTVGSQANASAQSIATAKLVLLAFVVMGLVSAVGSVVLQAFGLPWWALGVGALPIVVMVVLGLVFLT